MNYEEIVCDANNLYRAYKVSVKSSKWKESTQKFMMNFLRYIFEIQDDLINRTLQNGPTQEFELHERGRIRPITSIQIRDRIVRHSLCDEVLLPEVRKHIIYDNCASIKGRGISQQRKRFEIHLHKYYQLYGNLNVNKVIYGGDVLIDLTGDSVSADKILKGITAHDKSGAKITGTCTFDSDTSEDTAAVAEILVGKTAHARGSKLTGTMKNNGAVKGTISTVAGEYTVPQGYHDGSGKVSIDATEQAKLIATNIREGVTILGVEGAMSGSEDMKPQSKEVTPSKEAQTIMPDEEYNCLSQVTVKAIPYVETDNSAGGKTVTIG